MQFQRIKVKAAACLHAPFCICHWLKSNPVCYIYVTVPAITIVVKVHLTLSAVIRKNRARGGLTAVSANRHHGHFVKCKCFFFFLFPPCIKYVAIFSNPRCHNGRPDVHPHILHRMRAKISLSDFSDTGVAPQISAGCERESLLFIFSWFQLCH